MRMAREFYKPKNEGVYLHIYNRTVSLEYGQKPLDGLAKEHFKYIFERHLLKYNLDIISLVLLGNHYHMLVYVKPEQLTKEQALNAYNKFHLTKKTLNETDPRILNLRKHSNNISEFMREVQLSFTKWFNTNCSYDRKGTLWQNRFQCQLIQSDVYLWSCLHYIELNPVRAGITKDPAHYEHSTFGRWSQNERHPYKEDFITHILSMASKPTTLKKFRKYMHSKMRLTVLNDNYTKAQNVKARIEITQSINQIVRNMKDFDMQVITYSKVEWRNKKVIGSDVFIREKYRQWELSKLTG